jgi:putative transposase
MAGGRYFGSVTGGAVPIAAVAGTGRGWKPFASRLSARREEAVQEAIKVMRKKAAALRVIDRVEEVGALCRS